VTEQVEAPVFADRVFVVVGANGGLGSRISRLLAAQGASLLLVARDSQRLAALSDIGSVVSLDIRKSDAAKRVVGAALETFGRIDGVVFAAGIVAFGSAVDTPDDVLIDVFTTNALAPIRLLRAAAPSLIESAEQGRDPFFCTISAVVAEQPVAGMAAYSAAKAAMTAYDTAAARELRRSGLRIIDVRPPHTETGLATRPRHGEAPRLPEGLSADTVAERIVRALRDGERDVPSSAFA
jgi:cyclic-di-GMP-binding biofilm dispersal mediator protein